jgi:hypothetical protein
MTHDVFGFGIARRLLVQEFHGGHALPFFGRLDPIGENDQARADLKGVEQAKAQAYPTGSEPIQIKPRAVEEMKKTVVGIPPKVQDADKTRDPGVIGPSAQAHQGENQPEKGAGTATGWAQEMYCSQPLDP